MSKASSDEPSAGEEQEKKRTRLIVLGDSTPNKGFPSNKVRNARYATNFQLLTWGLLRCIFSSVSSVYFFTVGMLQMFTPWSPTGKFATIGPYSGNKIFEMAYLYWFNNKDRKNDEEVNTRKVKVVTRQGVITKERKDLKVGDMIHIEEVGSAGNEERHEVPVDMLLVHSSTRDVFVDMSSLTGEKDSVQRKVPEGLELDDPSTIPLHGILYSSAPRPDLDHFRGEVYVGTKCYPCTYENIVLAGSYLFKGKDVYGLVIATGNDTKIRLKQTRFSHKSWSLQQRMNLITTITLVFLVTFIMVGAYGYFSNSDNSHSIEVYQVMAIYFLLFNGLIAQTLQFTLDVVRGVQAWEVDAEVKNPHAIEQLGLAQAIVFDKTGTLTQNKLQPIVLSVMGDRLYMIYNKEKGSPKRLKHSKITENLNHLLLSICLNNTVMRGEDGGESPSYFGTSADEVALMQSVFESAGYFIISRTQTTEGEELLLHTPEQCPQSYMQGNTLWRTLYVYKYTSKRGMMTVIVQNKHQKEARERVDMLASRGLRVLLFAYVELDFWGGDGEGQVSEAERAFRAALLNKDEAAMLSFRHDYLKEMVALGVTGTEDQLQPYLKRTMRTLQEKQIITLMCTGDIKLTAENIGKNCGILPTGKNAKIFDIHEHSDLSLEQQLERAEQCSDPKGLLVGKNQLLAILEDKALRRRFFHLVCTSRGVVTFRAHPKLKAMLTRFLMKNGLITCSVGDGANDIDMIKQAHIGVGIKDGENTHAAGSSDLAIKNVSQLPHLILHYGKHNWEKNVRMTHLISSMKMTIVLTLLFYDMWNGFIAKALFIGKMLLSYNFFYGWGTGAYGIFHLDEEEEKVENEGKEAKEVEEEEDDESDDEEGTDFLKDVEMEDEEKEDEIEVKEEIMMKEEEERSEVIVERHHQEEERVLRRLTQKRQQRGRYILKASSSMYESSMSPPSIRARPSRSSSSSSSASSPPSSSKQKQKDLNLMRQYSRFLNDYLNSNKKQQQEDLKGKTKRSRNRKNVYNKEASIDSISIPKTAIWWLTAALDSSLALFLSIFYWNHYSSSSSTPSPTIYVPLFAEDIPTLSFSVFVVIMIWVNLRVALQTRNRLVHWVTAITLILFAAIYVLPAWRYLPEGFVPEWAQKTCSIGIITIGLGVTIAIAIAIRVTTIVGITGLVLEVRAVVVDSVEVGIARHHIGLDATVITSS
ncbi:Ptype transporting ATPase-like protein [Balamuthia mandrillaris]